MVDYAVGILYTGHFGRDHPSADGDKRERPCTILHLP